MSTVEATRSIPFGRPWITDEDRQAVMSVLEGHILTHGPQCHDFEAEFAAWIGRQAHCVTVSSGMAALHLAYLHFGIGPGDEVIVPAMTHIATVHAVEWVGARPVFVDCDPATGNLTAAAIEAAITERTKAISLVHFQGIPAPMPEIMAIAEPRGIKVVEDCALAVGSRIRGKHCGLFGDAACFSFYPVKHFTTGEGGMFMSRHEDVVSAVARLRAFGVNRRHDERSIPGMYDVPELGLNYRMSEMQAALGRSQLGRIDQMLAARDRNFRSLKAMLQEQSHLRILDVTDPNAVNSHYSMTVVLEGPLAKHRNTVILRLKEEGVGTSVYYPQPVPRMTYYREKYREDLSKFPVATEIADASIALPVGPHIDEDDLRYICRQFQSILAEIQA